MLSRPRGSLLLWSGLTSPAPAPARAPRILVVDWLRGIAVVLMIQAHGFDAWLLPEAKQGPGYEVIRHLSGLPSRLFLFLVGVSAAIKFESGIRRQLPTAVQRAETVRRGLLVIGLAYLFRLQEWVLSGFWGGIGQLLRVDILNCIGASLVVLGLVSVPRRGRPQIALSLLGAALFLGLGPLVGPATFPDWLPRPLTSYLGGQRPMAWFTLFPWAAWALLGAAVGHLWLRHGRSTRGQAVTFLLTGALGVATTATVVVVRKIDPFIIRYPSELVQQMGPGSFFFRLGIIGAIAAIGWGITRLVGDRPSFVRQLGQTSLLVYWVHVELCYGHLADPLKHSLSIPQATAGIAALTVAMYALSVLKTRHGAALVARLRALRGSPGPAATAAPPSTPGLSK